MTMEQNDFFERDNIFLVVGASDNQEKYGSRVFTDLLHSEYNVIAINPRLAGKELEGTPVYATLSDFYKKISVLFNDTRRIDAIKKSVIVFVTKPKVSVDVLHEALDHGVTKVWFQPGSESEEAVALCRENKVQEIHGECVMLKHN